MSNFIIEKSCNTYQTAPEPLHLSLVMYGMRKCSGSCYYCTSRHSMGYDEEGNKESFVLNKEKIIEKILYYLRKVENNENLDFKKKDINIDIWGANPLDNFSSFKETIDFIEKDIVPLFHSVEIHTSGNGLEFAKKGVTDYLIEHRIGYQLSHDGIGQILRTGDVDPLYWDKTKDSLVRLAKECLFDWINCTLSKYNPSPMENIEYFNRWKIENGLMGLEPNYIKLNHIYAGSRYVDKIYYGKGNDYIKSGDKIGWLEPEGESLKRYIKEFECLMMASILSPKNIEFEPYRDYLRERVNWYLEDTSTFEGGSCRRFQMGEVDYNFVIDTTGEFCQCNLLQHDVDVVNKKCIQPDYCKNCEFKDQQECLPCGAEGYEKENPETHRCTFRYAMNKMHKRVHLRLNGIPLKKEDFDYEDDWEEYQKQINPTN